MVFFELWKGQQFLVVCKTADFLNLAFVMNEFASDTVWADTVLMVSYTLFGLVEWVCDDLASELVLAMGVLAFEAIATGLGSAPLAAHFRFIFAFVDFSTSFLGLF